MNPSKIRLIIVDDNPLYRKVIKKSLSYFENVHIVGEAFSGESALEILKDTPADLVLLDIHMPGMGGLQTLGLILQKFSGSSVVLISGISQKNAPDTIMGLRMGALDFIPKPGSSSVHDNFGKLKEHLARCLEMVVVQKTGKKHLTAPHSPVNKESIHKKLPNQVNLIVIGVSTGGPKVLTHIFSKLNKPSEVPILIVQHMPADFTKTLAANLDKLTAIDVCEAEHNMPLERNKAYFAPGGKHMELKRNGTGYVLEINEKEKVNSCRPSVDLLFQSIADNYKLKVVSLVLTGMGQDGLNGVKALRETGSYSITQSESSCTIYGMPKVIAEAGLSDASMDIQEISEALIFLTSKESGT